MSAPLSVPRVQPGFPPLVTAGGQTARPGGLTALGTEVGGQTVSPGGQTAPVQRRPRLRSPTRIALGLH
jgi:hypothetical protein